jgi:hypothetical protein
MKGELMLARAATAQALVENLEDFFPIVELPIHIDPEEMPSEELSNLRDEIVKNVIAFMPPRGPNAMIGRGRLFFLTPSRTITGGIERDLVKVNKEPVRGIEDLWGIFEFAIAYL